jgi:hypothetical protein
MPAGTSGLRVASSGLCDSADIWNESSLQPVWSDVAAFSQPNGVEDRAEVCEGLPVSPRMGGRKVTVELRDESAWVGSYHGVKLLTAKRDEAMGLGRLSE